MQNALMQPTPCGEFDRLLNASAAAARDFNSTASDLETRDPAGYQRELRKLVEASRGADAAIPTNWHEFARLLDHMCEGGESTIDDENAGRLLDHTRRLLDAASMEGRRDALRTAWEEALAEYRSLRATSDALPLGTENEDAAVNAYLDAMDRLLVETPAPDLRAVSIKMELAQKRYDGSGHIPAFADAIREDVDRLQREGC